MPSETFGRKTEAKDPSSYICTLTRVAGFRQEAETDGGDKIMRRRLSFWWEVEEDPGYFFNQGFITLSLHDNANFRKILSGLGLDLAGQVSVDYEFESDDIPSFDEAPLYTGGPKRDVEQDLSSLKVNGNELLGTRARVQVIIADTGYNKVIGVWKLGDQKINESALMQMGLEYRLEDGSLLFSDHVEVKKEIDAWKTVFDPASSQLGAKEEWRRMLKLLATMKARSVDGKEIRN
jgi:hypothetical protein